MFGSTVQAAFVSVEDFESYNLGGVAGYDLNGTPIAGSPNPTSLWRTNDNTQYTVVSDMSGGSPKVLLAAGNGTMDVATLPAMPDIANNTTATVYFRMKVLNTSSTAGYNRRLGPSGAPASPLTSTDPTTGLFLSGSNFKPQNSSETLSFVNANCWWSFWVVVNNTANTYTIYYQREDGGSQSQLAANKGFSGNLAGSSSPLTDFYLFYWGGPTFYLDDIHIDTTGVNLTTPQIPTRVGAMAGSESPTVHSPGDAMTITVGFPDTVTLSQAGGAKLQLNIAGILVDAVQTGFLTGTSLTFEATAPAITTMAAKVVANSLQLLNGATLRDSGSINVDLVHGEVALPNDQISVERLSVYPAVPGLAPSPRYSFRVHEVGSTQWMTPFAWFTKCIDKGTGIPNNAYYSSFIGGWSNTYCNFEMANNVPVEVEITKLNPSTGMPVDIQKAVAHPRRKVRSWRVENGKAYVIFDKPVLFAVDIDGQMDEHIAPRIIDNVWGDAPFPYTNENAFHTVTVFANPFILDKPVLGDPGVYAVEPGVIPPDDGPWTTLYFKPGVHQLFAGTSWDVGEDLRLRSNKTYYIPGDAMVHGNMNNRDDSNDGQNIRIFGHGTLSGERIDHGLAMVPPLDADRWRTRAIRIANNAMNCRVEGITITDPADHTCALVGGYNTDPAKFNYVRWAKSMSWRANGDGITPNGSGYIEDCFLRTQDDGSYIKGLGIRRIVYWNDCNGTPFRGDFITSYRGSNFPASLPQKLYVEDIDIIYCRCVFWEGPGRSVISLQDGSGSNDGNTGSHVVYRNINYEDPLPIRKLMGGESGRAGGLAGIRFENVRAAAPPVFGDSGIDILGDPNCYIRNLIFDNVTMAGQHYDSMDDIEHNQYVYDFIFENTLPETMTYLNTSGYGKWYVYGDWDSGVEPANNDIVNHTAGASVLTVDAPAYAGTLNIAHADTATVSIQLGGDLTVTNGISMGASGRGEINLLDGFLELKNSASGSLSITNGKMHIENGTLLWAGNHISDIQSLYTAGKLTLAKGQDAMLSESATLIGQYGQSKLYADYNNANPGYTTVWVARLTQIVVNRHVEAENYTSMSGIQKENTSDTGGGQNIGYIENGDWAQYTINIPVTGTYQVDFRVASGSSGGTINMVVGSSTIGSAAVTGTGGWQTWKTVSTTATFNTVGTQTLRLNFVGGSGYLYNVNWFKCTMSIPLLPGDFNGDKKVNLVDFELLSSDWQNGYEMTDLLEMAEHWLIH
jgi:hypothetical protein